MIEYMLAAFIVMLFFGYCFALGAWLYSTFFRE
jgi:hypothetical protein